MLITQFVCGNCSEDETPIFKYLSTLFFFFYRIRALHSWRCETFCLHWIFRSVRENNWLVHLFTSTEADSLVNVQNSNGFFVDDQTIDVTLNIWMPRCHDIQHIFIQHFTWFARPKTSKLTTFVLKLNFHLWDSQDGWWCCYRPLFLTVQLKLNVPIRFARKRGKS